MGRLAHKIGDLFLKHEETRGLAYDGVAYAEKGADRGYGPHRGAHKVTRGTHASARGRQRQNAEVVVQAPDYDRLMPPARVGV